MSTHAIAVAYSHQRPEERSGSATAGATVLGPAFIGGLALALAGVVLLGRLSGNLLGRPTRVTDWSAPGVERSRIS